MQNDEIKFEVNWELSRRDFLEAAKTMIEITSAPGKTIPIPVEDDTGPAIMLLAGLNCGGCHLCCKSVMAAGLLETEIKALQKNHGTEGFTKEGLIFPCRFLTETGCSIYAERPLVCITYPLQGGAQSSAGKLLAVESVCPQAREIALRAYAIAWDISHKRKQLKAEAESVIKGGDKRLK